MSSESNTEMKIEKAMNDIRTKRDELNVKAHLMKADAKDKLDDLEKKYNELKEKKQKIASAAEESKGDIESAADLLIDELKTGYENLKKAV